jgi:DNA-directed RNA polymerase specialized sigma24 family protein
VAAPTAPAPAEHLRAWLYRVTTTTALDHLRARGAATADDERGAVSDPEHYGERPSTR